MALELAMLATVATELDLTVTNSAIMRIVLVIRTYAAFGYQFVSDSSISYSMSSTFSRLSICSLISSRTFNLIAS